MMTQEQYVSDAVQLLKKLIATPSVSRSEKDAADIMEQTIRSYGFEPQREANNLWIIDPHYDESRPTLLLNAHIDTVKPVASWSRDPFSPDVEDGVLYGLGSNDCGGGLCSLLQIFRMLTEKPQSYNLIYLASAEGWHHTCPALASTHRSCHCGRTYRHEPCRSRKGTDGAGCYCSWQEWPCGKKRRSECDLRGTG